MAKATIEVEIPDGYEFDRFDYVGNGELFIGVRDSVRAWELDDKSATRYIIVRKVEPVTELAVRFKPGWVAMDQNGQWFWYSNKPEQRKEYWTGRIGLFLDIAIQMPSVTDWKQSLMRVG